MSETSHTLKSSTLLACTVVGLAAAIALAMLLPSPADYGKPLPSADAELAVARRISKVGQVNFKQAAKGPREPRAGEAVYAAMCSACHASGVSGAPRFQDAAAWAPRIAQGFETLVNSASKGKNAMPAQAGGAASELEVARAVAYMANAAGAQFEEPAAADQ